MFLGCRLVDPSHVIELQRMGSRRLRFLTVERTEGVAVSGTAIFIMASSPSIQEETIDRMRDKFRKIATLSEILPPIQFISDPVPNEGPNFDFPPEKKLPQGFVNFNHLWELQLALNHTP